MTVNRRNFLKSSLAFGGGLFLPGYLSKYHEKKENNKYDIVVYGASSAGVIAAVAAARKGRSVILIEPSNHLGGLTTGGLGQTDIGIEGAIGGVSLEFYRRIREYYKQDSAWEHQTWDEYMSRTSRLQEDSEGMIGFEPKVALKIYKNMLEEAEVPVVLNARLLLTDRGVVNKKDKIREIVTEDGNVYRGDIVMSAI